MKTTSCDALSNEDLNLIAERCREEAYRARINGHSLGAGNDLAAKFADYIVVLRTRNQTSDEKKPGLRQRAV